MSSRKKKHGKPVGKKKSGLFSRKKTTSIDNVFALSADNPRFEVVNPAFEQENYSFKERVSSFGKTANVAALEENSPALERSSSHFGVRPPPGAVGVSTNGPMERAPASKPRKLANGMYAPQPPSIPKHLYDQCQVELRGAIEAISGIVTEKGICNGAQLEELAHVISVAKARGVTVESSDALSEAIATETKLRGQLTAARSVETAMSESDLKQLNRVLRIAERKGVKVEMKFRTNESSSRGTVPSLALPLKSKSKK